MGIEVSQSQESLQAPILRRPKLLRYAREMPQKKRAAEEAQREEDERIRRSMREVLDRDYGGHQGKLAAALDVSEATVSTFLAGKKGLGHPLFRAFERLTSSSSLSSAARKALDDPFPSRRIVVELARGEEVPEAVLQALLAVVPPSATDPGEDFWQETLLDLLRRRKTLQQGISAIDGASDAAANAQSKALVKKDR